MTTGYASKSDGFQTKFLGVLWFRKVASSQLRAKWRPGTLYCFIQSSFAFYLFYF